MSADWKAPARIRSALTLRRFRLEHVGEPCDRCEVRVGVHVHHRVFRSQGGSDVDENLEWLCMACHNEAHGLT